MSIISQLSSQVGDRSEGPNKKVAVLCLKNPKLLGELVSALEDKDDKLVGDAAEVFTFVAEEKPELVAHYIKHLLPLLNEKNTRARWEGMHALSLVVTINGKGIEASLDRIMQLVREDKSMIVRDYGVDLLANYAGIGKKQAQIVFPKLIEATEVLNGRQAHRAMRGLLAVVKFDASVSDQVIAIAHQFENHPKGTHKKESKKILRELEK